MKSLYKILSMMICLSFVLCACSSDKSDIVSTPGEGEDYKNGGTVKMACVPVDTLNPLITQHATVADFLSLVYEGLFVAMPDLTAEPLLATEHVASNDNTIYTIKLKKGVKFHNGKTFGSDDVVATLAYIQMYGGNFSSVIDNILNYSAPSSDTVIITLKSPVADFMNSFDFPILPAGLTADDFSEANSAFVPVGTGMYAYDSAEEYKNIYLKANTSWHREQKRPHIDKIDVEILSDEETIISAFDAGAIDILTTSWKNPAEMNLTSDLYNSFETLQNRFTYLGINTGAAAFDTADERKLLSSNLDSAAICEDIMLGSAVPATSPVRDGVYFNESDEIGGNHEKKSPSMEETDPQNDFAEDSSSPAAVLLYNSDSKTKERLALAIKHRLDAAGYYVTLDSQPFSAYLSKVANCEYDLYIGEVSVDNSANLEFMFGQQRSVQNVCCYNTAELATLVSNLNRMAGKENKSVAWENFEKYYRDNAFQIPLYFTKGAAYVNKRLAGTLAPNLSSLLGGFEKLYFKQ